MEASGAGISDGAQVDGQGAPVGESAPAPDTRTPEQAKSDALFGPDSDPNDPGASFGIRERREGRGGRQRAKSPNVEAPVQRARPIPPGAKPKGADSELLSSADAHLAAAKARAAAPDGAPEDPPTAPDPLNLNPEEGEGPIQLLGIRNEKGQWTKRFKTTEEASHFLASEQGRVRAYQDHATKAVHSAESWKAHAERQEAQYAALVDLVKSKGLDVGGAPTATPGRTAVPSTPRQDETGLPPKPLLQTMDWKVFSQFYRENPVSAVQWFADTQDQREAALLTHLESKLRSEFEERIKPLVGVHERSEKQEGAIAFFNQMATYSDEHGSLFPELEDENAVRAIATILTSEFPEDKQLTPFAFKSAVLHYRELAGTGRATGPTAAPTPSPRIPAAPVDTRSSAVLAGSDASPRPSAPTRDLSRGAALLEEISRSAGRDTSFGVRPRR